MNLLLPKPVAGLVLYLFNVALLLDIPSFIFQKTHASAIATRDLARQNQHRREVALLSEAKDRERRLIECRKTTEERKNYFETMERHMFATRSSVKVGAYLLYSHHFFRKVLGPFIYYLFF